MSDLRMAKKVKTFSRFHSGIALRFLYSKVGQSIPRRGDWKYTVAFNSVRTLCKKLKGKEVLVRKAISIYVESIREGDRFDVREFKGFVLRSGIIDSLKDVDSKNSSLESSNKKL